MIIIKLKLDTLLSKVIDKVKQRFPFYLLATFLSLTITLVGKLINGVVNVNSNCISQICNIIPHRCVPIPWLSCREVGGGVLLCGAPSLSSSWIGSGDGERR